MAEAQLRQQIESLQAELGNLRTQVVPGRQIVAKDLSLVSQIPKWTGTQRSISLEEFLEVIENTAVVGNWSDADKLQIAILKLEESARIFYRGNVELRSKDTTWEKFKAQFRKRFRDVRTDQYHFIQLQSARQKREETPQEFADRCRALAQKTVKKVEDPILQKVHYDQAERMLLAAYIAGLTGNPGQQVRFRMPGTIEEAVQIAMTVHESEREEKINASFYLASENAVQGRNNLEKTGSCHRGYTRPRYVQVGRRNERLNQQSAHASFSRHAKVQSELRCYHCSKLGHFAKDCYKRKGSQRQKPPNQVQEKPQEN
jgi:hypothetical protein